MADVKRYSLKEPEKVERKSSIKKLPKLVNEMRTVKKGIACNTNSFVGQTWIYKKSENELTKCYTIK